MNLTTAIKAYFIYSFLGWTAETVKNWHDKNFISCNAVFKYLLSSNICLIPFPPSYGLGGVFIAYLYSKYPNLSILKAALIFGIAFNVLELIGGVLGEKFVCDKVHTCEEKSKMWNYTATPNIGGYIDVEHTIYWMILGVIGYKIYPFLMKQPLRVVIFFIILIWTIVLVCKPKN